MFCIVWSIGVRIIFLISSLNSGGAERVASTLCNAWSARGDSVFLVPTFSGGGQSFYEISDCVTVAYLADLLKNSEQKGKRYLDRLMAVRALVRDAQPNVVVSFLPNVNVAALLATAFTKVPVVVCERSDPSMMPVGWFWRSACNASYRFADLLTVQTEAVKTSIHSVYGGLDQVAVVPNPLPEGLLDYRADLNAPRARRVLLSLGRLSEEKRVGQIIEAFAGLAPDFPEWDLHIYGDGPEREQYASIIKRNGVENRIFLQGRTDKPWSVMASVDAFVMNSRFEGFPNALLEAMGVGLPCVSSDCPSGPREISRDGKDALLVPPGDVASLRSALARMMGDSELRADLGARARESVVKRYSLDAVLAVWDGVFRQVGAIQ